VTTPTPPSRPPKSNWSRHYWGKIVSAVLFLAAVAAIGSFVITDLGFKPWLQTAPTSTPGSQNAVPSGGTESDGASPPGGADKKAGACLDEAGSLLSCDRPHSSELVTTTAACDLSALVGYAGGIFTRDVLRGDVAPAETSHGCIVKIPEGLSTKIQDGLSRGDHATLRQCWNRFTERDVSCDQAHTAEVVYFNPDPGATEISCGAHADSYTADAFGRHQEKLEVIRKTSGPAVSCLVQARGSNELIGSLRNLGTGALPLQARP
jgi:hypothetical protein